MPPKDDVNKEISQYRDQTSVKKDLLSSTEAYSKEKIEAQIVRSYATTDDYSIWDAYRKLFRDAKRNIYIENQYAFEDEELKNILRDNISKNNSLKVIIVAPVKIGVSRPKVRVPGAPDVPLPEGIFDYNKTVDKNLRELVEASMINNNPKTARVAVFSLMSNYQNRRVPIYVHSKTAIVDEEWSMVGSANLDQMGMGGKGVRSPNTRGSSEIGILVHGRNHALALRKTLAEEHLDPVKPSNSLDFNAVFDACIQTATKNGMPNGTGNLRGHLVFHRIYHTIDIPAVTPPSFSPNPGALPAWVLRNRLQGGQGPLTRGDLRKDLVKHLQKMLIALGHNLGPGGADGIFGSMTESAIKSFQSSHTDFNRKALSPDMLVGSLTSDSINRAMLGKWYNNYTVPPLLVQHYEEVRTGKKVLLPNTV